MELIYLNKFDSRRDNAVKPLPTTWPLFVELLASGHTVLEDKAHGVLFNCVRYRTPGELAGVEDATVKGFDGQLYTRRLQRNIATVDLLVLDFDGTISIQEAKRRFQRYEHCGFTSYSHMVDGEIHKFRLIVRLAEPIPAYSMTDSKGVHRNPSEWYLLRDALHAFAGPCDPASLNANQIYYMPSVSPTNEAHAQSWFNSGESLDWRKLDSVETAGTSGNPTRHLARAASKRAKMVLRPDDVLRTASGPIRTGDIQGKIEGVWCPFHDDRNGTEFVRRVPESGRVFLFCRHCDRRFDMVDPDEDVDDYDAAPTPDLSARAKIVQESRTLSSKEKKLRLKEINRQAMYDLLDEPGTFNRQDDTQDRKQIAAKLAKIHRLILKPEAYRDQKTGRVTPLPPRAHVVYMPEGAGKSMLAVDIARGGRTVVFACKSWDQAFEKYESFRSAGREYGLNVKLFLSREAKAYRRFGVKGVHKRPSSPYDSGQLDDEASIQQIVAQQETAERKCTPRFVRLLWHFFREDNLVEDVLRAATTGTFTSVNETSGEIEEFLVKGSSKVQILVTSFAQLRTLHERKQYLPEDWIVWFDDPDISDVLDVVRYDPERYGKLDEEKLAKKTKEINGRRYYRRRTMESLGWAYSKRIRVFTTTERITLRAIQRLVQSHRQRCSIHDEMGELAGGRITILGTNKVFSRIDAVIPLLVRRLNKEGHPSVLIGDGLGQTLNHSSSKGKNTLDMTNVVVEISKPHPTMSQTVCDGLGLSWEVEGRNIDREIMLDQLHQAIGRNSGYRFKGFECVTLVDRNHHKWLVKNMRYFVDPQNSVLVDRTNTMSRRDRRITSSASEFVSAIEAFLNNLDPYFEDGRKVLGDIDSVMNAIPQGAKRTAYAKRLLHAIYSLSGCHPGNKGDGAEGPKEAAYRRATQRIQRNCNTAEWDQALGACAAEALLHGN